MVAKRGTCDLPPKGWYCSSEKGHTGPCPTYPEEPILNMGTNRPWLARIDGSLTYLSIWDIIMVGLGKHDAYSLERKYRKRERFQKYNGKT